MAKHDYYDYLRSVPLFAGLEQRELDAVGRATTELSFPAGEVLMREGQLAHEMYVVIEGILEVTRAGRFVADIGPGGFAGEMALLTNHERDATVTTKTPVRLLHIDGRSFSTVLREAPNLAAAMLPVVAERVVQNSSAPTN